MQKWIKKLFSMKKEGMALLFLCGVLLLLIAMPTEKKTSHRSTVLQGEEETKDYEKLWGKELSAILSQMEGVGRVKVMLTLSDAEEEGEMFSKRKTIPEVKGVLVVAEGGANPEVKQKILEAVEALFQIESHKISIVKRKS